MAREKDTRTPEQRRAEINAALDNPAFAGKTNDELGAICNVDEKTIRNAKRRRAAEQNIKTLTLNVLTLDDRLQMRAAMNEAAIRDYADAMRDGAKFPALLVISDGATSWLVDGWHRYRAAKLAGLKSIECDVRAGDFNAALMLAYGANAGNAAVQRTNADKRKAVTLALADPQLATLTADELAVKCNVSRRFVFKIKSELKASKSENSALCTGDRDDNNANPLQQPALADKSPQSEKSETDTSAARMKDELTPDAPDELGLAKPCSVERPRPQGKQITGKASKLAQTQRDLANALAENRQLKAELAALTARIHELEASQSRHDEHGLH